MAWKLGSLALAPCRASTIPIAAQRQIACYRGPRPTGRIGTAKVREEERRMGSVWWVETMPDQLGYEYNYRTNPRCDGPCGMPDVRSASSNQADVMWRMCGELRFLVVRFESTLFNINESRACDSQMKKDRRDTIRA
ncbi:hypothetical protein BKA70DRAFT_1218317 [Coprinopsis sp. MPI-PUGE-AT-0042]|nr:hypothetical protein BKA70DRAFT_1218317 [Coprinopsis sp. MPI-PUGE-AT-0042]